MQLPLPFVQLPLQFDAAVLAAEVAALGEDCWMPHPQGFPGNSMLPLIAVGGDPADESFAGPMRPVPLLQRCPYLMQTMAALGVTLGRSRLMRLSGHAEVTLHADQGYYWADRVRVHVPIVTQPTVRFECGGEAVNMAPGECWIFDTWRQHRVRNDAEHSRIHLVVDTVGGDRFWSLVAAGRGHDRKPLGVPWQPQAVAPQSGPVPALVLESLNVPAVMTPWEASTRIGFLLGEARPHANLPLLQKAAARFLRHWQALWAAHGDRGGGLAEYGTALARFMDEVQRLGAGMVLRNELVLTGALVAQIGKMALTGPQPAAAAAPAATPAATPAAAPVVPGERAADPLFERPVFIVSAPRSGSTLLFETLSQAPGLYTIGGESHALIEGIPALSPVSNGMASNRLTAAHATADVARRLRERFQAALVDRDGNRPGGGRVRVLEKTPKNALRVPFLAQAFPEALFVYLYRDPRQVLGSMLDAWQSGRFRTYPGLPGWPGPPWSLLLVPEWQALAGRPLAEVVATQWDTTMRILHQDLAALPAERVIATRYDRLLADPAAEVRRLCQAAGLDWDRALDGPLPAARYTLSAPAADKWRRHADAIAAQLPRLRATIEYAERLAPPPLLAAAASVA